MRFADECRGITRFAQLSGKTSLASRQRQIDTIIHYAVSARIQTGQQASAGRLAHRTRCGAGLEAGAISGELVQMWSFNAAALEAETVAAMLIGSDEQDIGSLRHIGCLDSVCYSQCS